MPSITPLDPPPKASYVAHPKNAAGTSPYRLNPKSKDA